MTKFGDNKVTGGSDNSKHRAGNESDNIRNMSIKDMIERRVREYPEGILMKADGIEYAWRDIDRGASVIAGELYALGAGSGSHVALCGANSVNWILTFFAIQKIGAVAVVLNPQFTSEEITALSMAGDFTHFCLGNASVRDRQQFLAQITDPEKSRIREVLDVGDEIDFLKRPLAVYPDVRPASDHACLIIFTSGSTGTPKGVMLSPSYLFSSSDYCVRKLKMTVDDRICAILPFFHIFGLTAVLLSCVICGSLLVLPCSLKPDKLISVLKNEKCTILHSVPTVLIRLVNSPGFSEELVSGIRASYISGSPVSEAQLKILMRRFPNNHFLRRYGLTEMTPVSSTDLEDDTDHILYTVGKPVDGADVRIKDMETDNFCPAGIQGEIVVKGNFKMSGYYKQPTDKQPFDRDGFLQTGDLGFLDEEGYLHYTGRAKEIIIRGGENIMPNEVASAISMYENVVDVKVIGVPDEIYGEIVTAAVVLKEGVSFDGKEIRDFLMTKLARYKIPAYFFIYEKLPSLANGKIDTLSLKKEIINRLKNIG
ncbi:MAG: acyl--CoA ligase [Lachnospiraceae bacterium]|nr:acyl--CoA ligase [Lachnospiraceae bacterium]